MICPDIIVPASGGKDSQACLKLAVETFGASRVRGLFCDTRWEHPLTYAHISHMERLYGVIIDRVTAGSVEAQCLKHGSFPVGGQRFCTEELKLWPAKRYYHLLALVFGRGFEVWLGMRTNESPERATRYAGKVGGDLYPPHDVLRKFPKRLEKLGVMFRLPVLEWSEKDVKDFVGAENLNPLYAAGFDRVGCFPCEASGEACRERAYNFDDFGRAQYGRVINIAAQIGKPIWRTKSRQHLNADGPGCAFCAL